MFHKTPIITNKCCKCRHKWRDQPGAFATVKTFVGYDYEGNRKYSVQCPQCGSLYFKWVSFRNDKRNSKCKYGFGKY